MWKLLLKRPLFASESPRFTGGRKEYEIIFMIHSKTASWCRATARRKAIWEEGMLWKKCKVSQVATLGEGLTSANNSAGTINNYERQEYSKAINLWLKETLEKNKDLTLRNIKKIIPDTWIFDYHLGISLSYYKTWAENHGKAYLNAQSRIIRNVSYHCCIWVGCQGLLRYSKIIILL